MVSSDYTGTVFSRGVPTAVDNPRWEEFAKAFTPDQRLLNEHKLLVRTIKSELRLAAGAKLLEVGAGLGILAFEMANQGVDVWDLDIVSVNADLVSKVAVSTDIGVKVVEGDSVHLPFADRSFDAVFSMSVFEHIYDQRAALDEQIRILKPCGRLMIVDGNFLNPKLLYFLLLKRKAKRNGLRWLLTKGRAYTDYGIGWHGKNEDIKTVYWWRREVRKHPQVTPIKITTTRRLYYPDDFRYKVFEPIAGAVAVVLEKLG
jgi:ubiquinone/menaquinone biosynthesis C-methylase UbiE